MEIIIGIGNFSKQNSDSRISVNYKFAYSYEKCHACKYETVGGHSNLNMFPIFFGEADKRGFLISRMRLQINWN